MIYSTQLLTAKHRNPQLNISIQSKFVLVESSTFNKALLEHKFLTTRFITRSFTCSKASAEQVVNALKIAQGPGNAGPNRFPIRFGVVELMGTDGECCAVIQYPFQLYRSPAISR